MATMRTAHDRVLVRAPRRDVLATTARLVAAAPARRREPRRWTAVARELAEAFAWARLLG